MRPRRGTLLASWALHVWVLQGALAAKARAHLERFARYASGALQLPVSTTLGQCAMQQSAGQPERGAALRRARSRPPGVLIAGKRDAERPNRQPLRIIAGKARPEPASRSGT